MSPHDLIPLLRRYWAFIVALVLVGVAAGIGASLATTPVYTATSKVFVSLRSSTAASVPDIAQGNTAASKLVDGYAEVATSATVLDPVIKQKNLNTTSDVLAKHISVGTSSNSPVMSISVTDPSAFRAADLSNAVAKQLGIAVTGITQGQTKGSATVSLSTFAPALQPKSPSSPNTPVNALVGGILGLLVALLLVALRRLLLNKVETTDELEPLLNVPVVGEITRDRAIGSQPLRVLVDPLGAYTESVRDLRTNLQYLTTAEGAQTIVLTSSGPGEGKTTTAVNLALSLADAQSVILVDADLRKPRVAATLGIDGAVGLTDVLVGRVSLDDALQTVGENGLVVLPSGGVPPNASELLQSQAMKRLIGDLSQRYATVLFDTPPAGLLSDARVLARETSGALVLAALRRSKRPQLRATATAIERAGARVLGVVATFVPATAAAYYNLEVAEGRKAQTRRRWSRKRAQAVDGLAAGGSAS